MNKNIFKSLYHRNFRLFFTGQTISVIGTWLQITTMPWFVYRLTKSTLLLGFIGFLSQIFILLLSPFAGAVADQYNRKKLLFITQTFAMIQALLLGILTLSGKIQIWHIIILAGFIGIVNAFDMPTRQSYLVEIVGKDDLMNAIALNSSMFNAARLIGPAIAGILIAAFGEGLCFLINGISFIAVIIALYLIKQTTNNSISNKNKSIYQNFLSGIKYIQKSVNISTVLLFILITGIINAFLMILMPVFVKDVYILDAKGLGVFMSSIGVGAFIGAITHAARNETGKLKGIIFRSSLIFGIFLIAFAFSKNIFFAILCLAFIGYFLISQMIASNTFIQLIVPDEMRGRVMGFYSMSFMGFAPIGSLIAGFLAHNLTAPITVAIGGFACVLLSIVLRKRLFAKVANI
jgi:MFS family permease